MNFTCVVIQTPTLRPNNSSTIFMPRWSPTLPVWPRVVNTGVYYILTTTANTRPTMSSQSTHQPQPWFPRWWFTLPVTLIGRILLWDLAEVQVYLHRRHGNHGNNRCLPRGGTRLYLFGSNTAKCKENYIHVNLHMYLLVNMSMGCD